MSIYKSDDQAYTAPLVITKARCILIDVEGTTSALGFIDDVLFPFVRTEIRDYLRLNWHSTNVQKELAYLATDLGYSDTADWFDSAEIRQTDPDSVGDSDRETDRISENAHQNLVVAEVERLMDADAKSSGLKELQSLIWEVGYRQGKLSSHVYDDVAPALKAWKEAAVDLRIFSSKNINAQKVFFQHTKDGALCDYLSGHYDTTTGPKSEAESYRLIAADAGFTPSECLFLSDMEPELQAAHDAGMQVALVARPGNATMKSEIFPVIQSFDQISVVP